MKLKLTGKRRHALTGWLYISPWVLGFLLFTLYPIVASLVMSFYDWDLFGDKIWLGFQNYIDIFQSNGRGLRVPGNGTAAQFTFPFQQGVANDNLFALLGNRYCLFHDDGAHLRRYGRRIDQSGVHDVGTGNAGMVVRTGAGNLGTGVYVVVGTGRTHDYIYRSL